MCDSERRAEALETHASLPGSLAASQHRRH